MAKHKYLTVEQFQQRFNDYVKHQNENPIYKSELSNRTGEVVKIPLKRELTIEGFKNYCYDKGCDIDRYWKNTDNSYKDYVPIITRIKEKIRQSQYEAALCGIGNPNFTARLNGLGDKLENNVSANIKILNNDPLEQTDE